jgi:WD40 repeat protein
MSIPNMLGTAAVIDFRNVFPGLRPFRPDEEHLFFGRESQVDSMVDVLAKSRFLAVVGTSGSGKSSLVNCGLRPALRRGLMADAGTSWRMAQFRPGSGPIRAMIHALAGDGVLYRDYKGGIPLEEVLDTSLRISKRGVLDAFRKARLPQQTNLLIIVDQFEELFRYQTRSVSAGACHDFCEEAIAFVNLLLEAKSETNLPVYIVITMRSDFLGNCAEFPGLPEAINEGQYLVPRMTRDERRAAIKGPIAVGGAKISPVLLSRLVNDVGDNPDQLSILQHALNRTWAHWRNEGRGEGPISLEHYEAVGTMTYALDRHAEKAYAELRTDRQRKICEKVFKALTDKGTDVRGIRRPASVHTLSLVAEATVAEVTDVINVFRKPSRSFLMPPLPESLEPASVIDISHESLMRVWERLRLWADEEAQSAQLYRRLSESASLHAEGKAALWRDPELQLAVEWRNKTEPTPTWAECYGGGFEQAMMFLVQSEAFRQCEIQEEEEHAQRKADYEKAVALAEEQNLRIAVQIKAHRRLRQLLTMLAILFVAAAFAGIRAVQQERKAEKLQRVSKARELAALAISTLKEDPERSVLLGMQAVNVTLRFGQSPVPAALDALQTAILSLPENTKLHHTAPVLSIAYSSDGKNIVTGSADNLATVWDARNGNLVLAFKEHTGPVTGVAFSPDGKAVASVSEDGTLRVWEATSGKGLRTFNLQSGPLTALAYSPDGGSVLVGSSNKTATLRDVLDGKLVLSLRGHTGSVTGVAFSSDGKFLGTASSDRTAMVWNRSNGKLVSSIRGHLESVNSVAFSPTGSLLATAGSDNTARLWDFRKAIQVRNLRQSGAVKSVAFSPDGKWLAIATDDTASVWDVGKGVQVLSVRPLGSVNGIAFEPSGKRLATASADNMAQLWHLDGGKGLLSVHHLDSVNDLSFSPDGTKLATASSDNTAKVWDSSSGGELLSLSASSNPVNSVAFSKDGKHLAMASTDGTATVWDIQNVKRLFTVKGHEASVNGTTYSPDNKTFATASADGTARIWDATKEGPPLLVLRHAGPVNFVVYSPDGKRLATASSDGTARVWDMFSGEPLLTLKPGGGVLDVAYSRDGQRLMTAGSDGDVSIWNAFTGELIKPPLHGHSSSVLAVVCSPDNRHLATASQDGTAKIWNMAEKQLVETLSSQSGAVNSVAYSPDGKRIATANTDGTVQFYALDVLELLKLARLRTSRNLTSEECSHYLQTDPCPPVR